MDQRLLERVWVGYFLSHRTLKIPWSINKPVSGSKIVGKTYISEKKRVISNRGWLVNIFYCISYMDYHFNVCFFSVQTDAFLTVYVRCCGLVTEIFLIIMQSGLGLLNASRRGYCHIENDLIIWKLNSISPMQSTAKFSFPVVIKWS